MGRSRRLTHSCGYRAPTAVALAACGSASGRSSRCRRRPGRPPRGGGCGRHGLRPRAMTRRRPCLLDRPAAAGPGIAVRMVDDDPALEHVSVQPGASLSWAIGFRSGRVAGVERLEWVDAIGSTSDLRTDAVDVAVSVDGPAGPWRDAGHWTLERAPDGSVAPFRFPEETWARSVRLTWSHHQRVGTPGSASCPVSCASSSVRLMRPIAPSWPSGAPRARPGRTSDSAAGP